MKQRTLFRRTFLGVWLLWILPLGTALAVICRYWIDIPVAYWCWLRYGSVELSDSLQYAYSNAARDFLTITELFGDWIGVCIIGVLILEIDRLHRARVCRFFGAVCLASAIVGLIKSFVVRIRPYGLEFQQPELLERQNVISFDWSSWNSAFGRIEHSFPSGHTATAFAAFVTLSFLYPRGRNVFFLLAVLTGLQRILCCAHFSSDVITGAVVGLFAGGCCTAFSDLPAVFARLEKRKDSTTE